MVWTPLLIAIVMGLYAALPSDAGTINLAWDAAPGAASYRLYYGVAPGDYPTMLDTGTATTASVGGLTDNTCYYFAATAMHEAGESDFSNEVSVEPRRNNRPRACRR